jgi:hypothetical protein
MTKAKRHLRNPRRLREIRKAHQSAAKLVAKPEQVAHPKLGAYTKFSLPIDQIKRDMIKNFVFMALVVLLISILKVTNFGFDEISPFLKI